MLSKNKITILLAVFLIVAISWIIYQNQTSPKTGYVLIQEIYNEFDMKKEFEKKIMTTSNARKKIIDSMAFELNMLVKKIQAEHEKNKSTIQEFNTRREEYMQRKQNFEEDNAALTKQYDQEILTQLTQYVKDFGEQNHYTYIFGNDGNGSLMYANETKNITKEVTEFINKKYKGTE